MDLLLCINVKFGGGVFNSQLSRGAFGCQQGSVLCQQVSQLSLQLNKDYIFKDTNQSCSVLVNKQLELYTLSQWAMMERCGNKTGLMALQWKRQICRKAVNNLPWDMSQ